VAPVTNAQPRPGGTDGPPPILAPSTSTGHPAAMPVVIGADDALLLDHRVHHSVQTAAKLVPAQGTAPATRSQPSAACRS
jgi:hypothetical protein